MTHEEKLLSMIRGSSNPTAAAEVAISTILCFVEQLQPQESYCPILALESDEKE